MDPIQALGVTDDLPVGARQGLAGDEVGAAVIHAIAAVVLEHGEVAARIPFPTPIGFQNNFPGSGPAKFEPGFPSGLLDQGAIHEQLEARPDLQSRILGSNVSVAAEQENEQIHSYPHDDSLDSGGGSELLRES